MKSFVASILGVILLSGPVWAGLTFCNDTGVKASVAIGYKDGDTWTSEGWWTMAPGDCSTAVSGDLKNRYYYWRATNENGVFETGDFYFCVSKKVFTIAGDTECEARGYERLNFSEEDTGDRRDATVRLTAAMAPAGTQQGGRSNSTGGSNSGTPQSDTWDFAAIEANLQGLWVDAGDDAFATVISGNRLQDRFAGVTGAQAQWHLADTCDGADGGGPVMLVLYDGDPESDRLCWVLLELNDRNLKFQAVGRTTIVHLVRGN